MPDVEEHYRLSHLPTSKQGKPRVSVITQHGERITLPQAAETPEAVRTRFINLREAIEAEEAEYELDDIMEEVDHRNIKRVAESNIEYVLRRERLLSPDMHVVIAEGAYDYDLGTSQIIDEEGLVVTEGDLGHFGGDFGVYDGLGNIVAGGDATGTIAFDPPELLDLNVRVMEVF